MFDKADLLNDLRKLKKQVKDGERSLEDSEGLFAELLACIEDAALHEDLETSEILDIKNS